MARTNACLLPLWPQWANNSNRFYNNMKEPFFKTAPFFMRFLKQLSQFFGFQYP